MIDRRSVFGLMGAGAVGLSGAGAARASPPPRDVVAALDELRAGTSTVGGAIVAVRDGRPISTYMWGKASLPFDVSPIQIGTMGTFEGVGFTVIGRVRWGWTDGSWNEWLLLFDDGRDACPRSKGCRSRGGEACRQQRRAGEEVGNHARARASPGGVSRRRRTWTRSRAGRITARRAGTRRIRGSSRNR